MSMPPKKAAKAATPKGTHGGARGGGRKRSAVNAAGRDADDGPKRKQLGLSDLLGPQYAKKARTGGDNCKTPNGGGGGAAIKWDYVQHDGDDKDTNIPQEQLLDGRVLYDMDKDRLAVLKKQGPEVYHVDKDDELSEVEAEHPNARRVERHKGELLIQIDNDEPIWVTAGHVRAVEAPGSAW